ncbi:PucR family transcriptional regulator, partial [Streptomyces kanamyceticus]
TRPSGISLRIETDATEYDATAYDSWHLYLHDPDEAPPRLLHEIADVVARHQERRSREESGARERAAALLVLMDAAAREPEGPALRAALRACALPEEGPYQVVAADVGGAAAGGAGRQTVQPTAALGALTEALRHLPGGPAFAVGALPDGTVAAVVHVAGLGDDPADGSQREGGQLGGRQREGVQLDDGQQDGVQLEGIWPLLTACTPHAPVHGGIGDTARTPERLRRSLTQARYALAAARSAAPRRGELTHTRDMTTLPALLAGVPDDVRSAFLARTLGTLTDDTDQSQRTLLHTLETYLAHNGSWARTAEALHLHVNTVHYRIQRIETLTGRDLSRLDHKLDLYAALRCR